MSGGFCASCGSAAGAPTSGPAGAPASGITDNVASALCYLAGPITGVLFLVLEPYNRNRSIRFHAFQSIFYTIAYVLAYIVAGMLLPFGLTLLVGPLIWLATVVGWLLLMWKAYNGEKLVMPVIGPMAEKQA